MAHMFIRHQVQDFDKWKPAYDSHQHARAAAGLRELHLWHNLDAPNEIVLLFEVSDVKQARAFAESADLKERMKTAGVTDTPNILFLASD
jgi:hypothetical protein